MTSAEYAAAYAALKRQSPVEVAKARKKIKAAYLEAGRKVADIIRDGTLQNGDLDFATQLKVDQALLEATQSIGDAIREHVPELLTASALAYAAIETEFVTDALGSTTKLTAEGIAKMFEKSAQGAVRTALNSPLGKDGMSFWARVPNISKELPDDVVNLVRAAISQGRDVGKIAADINHYVKNGKAGTIHRWGAIEPDSAALLKRVPREVDYRALRLTRSELGRGLMEAAKANGPRNPGGSGWYDWVRVNAIDWGCACPTNQANSPYLLENFPPYSHPNCFCVCRQRMRDGTEFRAELQAWANGEPNERIDRWYREEYLPGQF